MRRVFLMVFVGVVSFLASPVWGTEVQIADAVNDVMGNCDGVAEFDSQLVGYRYFGDWQRRKMENGRYPYNIKVSSCNLIGQIPTSLGGWSNLIGFSVHSACQVTGSLPTEIGRLEKLMKFVLVSNGVQGSIPTEIALIKLTRLEVHGNHLTGTIPTEIGKVPFLAHLTLHTNSLSGVMPSQILFGKVLKTLSVFSNRLQGYVPQSDMPLGVKILLLHDNSFVGDIPCRLFESDVFVLTLHDNMLRGTVPTEAGSARTLNILTLHYNLLIGTLPSEFSGENVIGILTLHGNKFSGHLPSMALRGSCQDDPLFDKCNFLPTTLQGLHELQGSRGNDLRRKNMCAHGDGVEGPFSHACPRSCDVENCSKPTLFTAHFNRLSCAPPAQVFAASVSHGQALAVLGNRLSYSGAHVFPAWVDETEQQEFLLSPPPWKSWEQSVLILSCGLLVFVLCIAAIWKDVYASGLMYKDHSDMIKLLALPCLTTSPVLLFVALRHSTLYECGDDVARASVAYIDSSRYVEWVVAFSWVAHLTLGASGTSKFQKCLKSYTYKPHDVQKVGWWLLWVLFVALLSAPSFFFAAAMSLPTNHDFNPMIVNIFVQGAPAIILAVDFLIVLPVSSVFARLSGSRETMLLASARTANAWVVALATTIFLHEHCFGGWRFMWKLCELPNEKFDVSIGSISLLTTRGDICQHQQRVGWWVNGRCTRSIVETLAPLFLKKVGLRATVQPVVFLAMWFCSVRSNGGLRLRGLGLKTSGMLEKSQEVVLLVTLGEMGLFWGALIPILIPLVILAVFTNSILYRVVRVYFQVDVGADDMSQVSRAYLAFSLFSSLVFMTWFAWDNDWHPKYFMLGFFSLVLVWCSLKLFGQLRAGLRRELQSDSEIELTLAPSPRMDKSLHPSSF